MRLSSHIKELRSELQEVRANSPTDASSMNERLSRLQDLANLTRNSVRFGDARPTTVLSRPTPIQTRAFSLLGLKIAA